jgi:hypothetical protein
MKNLLLTVVLMLTASAASAVTTGGSIHFQEDGVFVNAAYSKSLCFDGSTFHALASKCVAWENDQGDRNCVETVTASVSQPQMSEKQRCVKTDGREGNCLKYITVPFFQSEVRTVNYYRNNDDQDLIKSEVITVPACK